MSTAERVRLIVIGLLSLLAFWLSAVDIKCICSWTAAQTTAIHLMTDAIRILLVAFWLLRLTVKASVFERFRLAFAFYGAFTLAVIRILYVCSLCKR